MKLMPLSTAARTIRMLSCSSRCLKPRCQPPRPMADTCSPVRPRTRYGIPDRVISPNAVLLSLLQPDVSSLFRGNQWSVGMLSTMQVVCTDGIAREGRRDPHASGEGFSAVEFARLCAPTIWPEREARGGKSTREVSDDGQRSYAAKCWPVILKRVAGALATPSEDEPGGHLDDAGVLAHSRILPER